MSEIKKELTKGVYYTAISKYAGIIVSLLITSILSRLLTPEDFGVMAIATVIIVFFNIFSDLGLGAAIIQNKELTEQDYSNIYSFTIFLGLILGLLFFFLSWPISEYYNNHLFVPICQILSINVFFATINIVPNSLLLKDKKFKFIAYRIFILQSIGGVSSVIAVFLGAGIYALLIAPIFSSIGIFVINYIYHPILFHLKFSMSSLRKIYVYSLYQFLFSFINYLSRNLDKLLIGRFLGMIPLGYYEKSYRLMTLPLQNITNVITPVMHPIFSEYQNDRQQLTDYYLKIVKLLAFIGFPLSVFLFFTANEIVIVIFGEQWIDSIPIFQILSLSVGLQVVLSSTGSIYQASNSTKALFYVGTINTSINIIGLLIGIFLSKSLNVIAWAVTISYYLNFVVSYWVLISKIFKIHFSLLIQNLISPLIVSALLVVVFHFINNYIQISYLLISILMKLIIFLIFLFIYIHIRGEYDIISFLKKTRNNNK